MISIVMGALAATVLVTLVSYALQGPVALPGVGLPRSIPLIDGLLTLLVVAGSRFTVRISEYYKSRLNKSPQARRVLIAGAGDAGQIVAREILSSPYVALFA